ncbi:hypothetical protein ACFSKW_27205 [Nonomuraea mangrovi]|uniref:Uncharacterized protein n=1 Tax=Nonomuraea mangrovi TaxID=2316207 RepID=A0ABW4T1F4_9ACTN
MCFFNPTMPFSSSRSLNGKPYREICRMERARRLVGERDGALVVEARFLEDED